MGCLMSIIKFSSIPFHLTKSTPRSGGIYLPSIAVTALILFYVLADAALLEATGIAIVRCGLFAFSIAALAAPVLWVLLRGLDFRLGSVSTAASALLAVVVLGVPFAYGMTALSPFPLSDAPILALDRLFGFDWHGFVAAIDRYPILCAILGFSYASITLQGFIIVIVAAVHRDHATINALMFSIGLSMILVNVVAYFVPTVGVTTLEPHDFVHLDVAGGVVGQHDYLALRDGTLKVLDFENLVGLVTFPSFHTVVAVLAVLASRRVPYLFGPAVVLNALMLISTFTHGGHYLSDVVIGATVAVGSWRLAEASAKWSFFAIPRRNDECCSC